MSSTLPVEIWLKILDEILCRAATDDVFLFEHRKATILAAGKQRRPYLAWRQHEIRRKLIRSVCRSWHAYAARFSRQIVNFTPHKQMYPTDQPAETWMMIGYILWDNCDSTDTLRRWNACLQALPNVVHLEITERTYETLPHRILTSVIYASSRLQSLKRLKIGYPIEGDIFLPEISKHFPRLSYLDVKIRSMAPSKGPIELILPLLQHLSLSLYQWAGMDVGKWSLPMLKYLILIDLSPGSTTTIPEPHILRRILDSLGSNLLRGQFLLGKHLAQEEPILWEFIPNLVELVMSASIGFTSGLPSDHPLNRVVFLSLNQEDLEWPKEMLVPHFRRGAVIHLNSMHWAVWHTEIKSNTASSTATRLKELVELCKQQNWRLQDKRGDTWVEYESSGSSCIV